MTVGLLEKSWNVILIFTDPYSTTTTIYSATITGFALVLRALPEFE